MKAIEIVETIMSDTGTSLSELAEYGDLGTKENAYRMLHCNDLKVGTFCKMLEVLGYQLIAQNTGNEEDIIVDYEEV